MNPGGEEDVDGGRLVLAHGQLLCPQQGPSKMQCTVYSVQCAVYNVQSAVYSVQFTMCSVQCKVYSLQCAV